MAAEPGRTSMPYVTAADGAQIFFEDWGNGPPVVLSHGWPLSSASWESQMLHLASNGFRVIAHDRRGHGRSTKSWNGNEMNTYADDLATLIGQLDLRDVMLVGFSTGGGEVARYIGRHGGSRVARIALVSAVTPFMLRTDDNPGGVPIEVFDALRAGFAGGSFPAVPRRSPMVRSSGTTGRRTVVSQGVRDAFWRRACSRVTATPTSAFERSPRPTSAPISTAFDMPTLVIHGDDDQIVPYEVGGQASAALVAGATLITYEGAPHGITDTHKERLSADLLAFARS